MNRFEYLESKLIENESIVAKEKYSKFYNGNEKTRFADGDLVLTSHRLFWGSHEEFQKGSVQLCLRLSYIQSITEESGSYIFTKKKRLICHLGPVDSNKLVGPLDNLNCNIDFIKISSKSGLSEDFMKAFRSTVNAKIWLVDESKDESNKKTCIKLRTGIVGIERSIISKQQETDKNISKAFKDLDVLMNMAQDMVKISKVISGKIKERNADISEDETIKFKTYLMSLGIEDPVTRNNFQSNSEYYKNLAKEITEVLLDVVGVSLINTTITSLINC
ncbi:VPS36 family protein [Megaselia abdita]